MTNGLFYYQAEEVEEAEKGEGMILSCRIRLDVIWRYPMGENEDVRTYV